MSVSSSTSAHGAPGAKASGPQGDAAERQGADRVEGPLAELRPMYEDFGTETVKDLYLAERNRRLTVRSQLAVPASVISFALFGYISLAQSLHVGAPQRPLTLVMLGLFAASMLLILVGAWFLARLEIRFMLRQLTNDETPNAGEDERSYLIRRYTRYVRVNDRAANDRARAFVLILASLVVFMFVVALLPFHLDVAGHGGSGGGSGGG
jgi:small-conductance mechanosensitive channel